MYSLWLYKIDKMKINEPTTIFDYLKVVLCFFIGHNYVKNKEKTLVYCTRCEDYMIIIKWQNQNFR